MLVFLENQNREIQTAFNIMAHFNTPCASTETFLMWVPEPTRGLIPVELFVKIHLVGRKEISRDTENTSLRE